VLVAIAARARQLPLPGWVRWAVPIAVVAFLLSYRRSFWLAAVFAVVFVLVVASRRRMRTAVAALGVGLAIVLAGTLTLGQGSNIQSPVVERARSLDPGRLTSTASDRYRLDEQRNVIEEVTRHPLVGLGMNVPWTVRHPLSEEHDRNYTHVVLLWYWLKLGLLGVFTYVWLIGMAIWTAFMVWRRHPDGLIRVAALGAVGGLAALAIVELTASFTGVEPRLTTAVGGLLGFIAAAWRGLPQHRKARATASTE
jgi:hypothetical protein